MRRHHQPRRWRAQQQGAGRGGRALVYKRAPLPSVFHDGRRAYRHADRDPYARLTSTVPRTVSHARSASLSTDSHRRTRDHTRTNHA
eukprot:3710728-Prymnesium_polylepis.2